MGGSSEKEEEPPSRETVHRCWPRARLVADHVSVIQQGSKALKKGLGRRAKKEKGIQA